MTKKIIVFFLAGALLLPNFKLAQADAAQATIDYLLAQPQNQWLTMALASSGQAGLDLDYLQNFNGTSANDYSKTILALTAANLNPYDYEAVDYIQALQNFYQNGQIGSDQLLGDDFWGIMALRSAGLEASDPIVQASKNFILTQQNPDGGWGFAPALASDTNDTAAAIMALLDAGLSPADEIIQQAVSYLHSVQNPDGGFPFSAGGVSDSGSGAWTISAIYKLGQDPASWLLESNDPLSHLQSLMLPDGSFKWVDTDTEGNSLLTAYAAVALNGDFYPVNYYQPAASSAVHLRLEGQYDTYCDADVEAGNALEIIINASQICGYTYDIQQTDFGPYLRAINNEAAEGLSGWLYWVNWQSPSEGANDHQLLPGDKVLWAFGDWPLNPARLILSETVVEPGENLTATVEYYNQTAWLPLAEATVKAGNQNWITNANGQASISLAQAGAYEVYAEKAGQVRSPRVYLNVGSGVSQSVNLSVNVQNPDGEETLSFIISQSSLDFGSLAPGQSSSGALDILNNGDVPLHLEAMVQGDDLFQNQIQLNSAAWENYQESYAVNQSREIGVHLQIPGSFNSYGQKSGNLIFWATGQ